MNNELQSQIEELTNELQTLSDQIAGKKAAQLPFLLLSQLAVDLNKTTTRMRKHRELLTAATGEE